MGKFHHTPEPWKYWRRDDAQHCLVTDESGAVAVCRPIQRDEKTGASRKEMDANMRIVEQAPKMFRLLRLILESIDDGKYGAQIDSGSITHGEIIDVVAAVTGVDQ